MLFHVTLTHKVDECPGYNPENARALINGIKNQQNFAEELNVKIHYILCGMPDHIDFVLLEADSTINVTSFISQVLPFRVDFRTVVVQNYSDLVPMMEHLASKCCA